MEFGPVSINHRVKSAAEIATMKRLFREHEWRLERPLTESELHAIVLMASESDDPRGDVQAALDRLGIKDVPPRELARRAFILAKKSLCS